MNYYKRFAATANSVGDWEGEEELAADQVNRIYRALDSALPEHVDPYLAQRMFERVWSDWSINTRLLDIGESDIQNYTRDLIQTAM